MVAFCVALKETLAGPKMMAKWGEMKRMRSNASRIYAENGALSILYSLLKMIPWAVLMAWKDSMLAR